MALRRKRVTLILTIFLCCSMLCLFDIYFRIAELGYETTYRIGLKDRANTVAGFPELTLKDEKYITEMATRYRQLRKADCLGYLEAGCHPYKVLGRLCPGFVSHTGVVTLLTQLSTSRIDRLLRLLDHWAGPISASLYINKTALPSVSKALCEHLTLINRTNVDIHVVLEAGKYYPINYLRNVALRSVHTSLVYLSDVDYVPGPATYREIHAIFYKNSDFFNKNVLVVPAFDAVDSEDKVELPQNKSQALRLLNEGSLKYARMHDWNPGHMPTKYWKWEISDSVYEISFSEHYEPYIVMRTDLTPPYSEKFTEYYLDKVSHILEVWAMGMTFNVMPNSFTVHYPHEYVRSELGKEIYKCAKSMYKDFVHNIREKYGIKRIPSFGSHYFLDVKFMGVWIW